MHTPIEWLLSESPWVEYRTRIDLLGETENNPAVIAARQKMLRHPLVQGLLTELAAWPGKPVNSHKKADLPMHKLAFIADLGIKADDPGMQTVVEKILSYQSTDGPFQVPMVIPTSFGGTGTEILAWALCDSPIILYALVKFGLADHPQVQQATQSHLEMIRENGYPCLGSKEMGTFRGPGKKEDPCPFATLVMLKALTVLPDGCEFPQAKTAARSLLDLWRNRSARHPYMFYMGTDFCKLKAPLNWYDLLHVCEVLTRIPELRSDQTLIEMVQLMTSKVDTSGRVTPDSIYLAWKDWDFGQKKEPSAWLTFLVHRVIGRMNSA
jgi:hypothetical protein